MRTVKCCQAAGSELTVRRAVGDVNVAIAAEDPANVGELHMRSRRPRDC